MRKIVLAAIALFSLTSCKDDIDSQLKTLETERDSRFEKISQIEDPEARKNLSFLVDMFHYIESGHIEAYAPYDGPTQYTQPRLKRLADYANPPEMADVFVGSLWANRTYINSAGGMLPFEFPLPHQLSWDSVILEDGSKVLIRDEYDPNSTEPQALFQFSEIRVVYDQSGGTPPDASPIAFLEGRFETPIPENVLTTTFDQSEIGDTKTAGDYLIKLTHGADHLTVVEITTIDGRLPPFDEKAVFIEAIDSTGGYLDDSSRSWGNPDTFKAAKPMLDKLIDAAVEGKIKDFETDPLVAEITNQTSFERQTSLYGQITFRGKIDKVQVTLLPPGNRPNTYLKSLRLSAKDLTDFAQRSEVAEIPVSGAVYDHEKAAFFQGTQTELDPAEFSTKVAPKFNADSNNISFEYPSVVSNIFLDTFDRYDSDAEDQITVSFLDSSGNAITPTADNAYEFTINRIEFDPALFPAPPARVTGQVPVRLMPNFDREEYGADTKPDTVEIDGNRVWVATSEFRNWSKDYRLLAYDSTGQMLKQAATRLVIEPDSTQLKVFYYYGDVGKVELLKAGPIKTAVYKFDVPLTPQE